MKHEHCSIQWAVVPLAALVCLTAGCGKREPKDVSKTSSQPAAEAPSAPPKTAAEERMASPAYIGELQAIHAERQAKAIEAAQIKQRMDARALAFEQEDAAAKAVRGEIEALKAQITAKEAGLAELARKDPQWVELEASYRQIETQMDSIRDKANVLVQQRLREQAAQRSAAAAIATGRTDRAVMPQPPGGPRVATNAVHMQLKAPVPPAATP